MRIEILRHRGRARIWLSADGSSDRQLFEELSGGSVQMGDYGNALIIDAPPLVTVKLPEDLES